MPTLLSISIGPVQEFIAASRKTRDLWFGSQLLSKAARAAAAALPQDRLIFPAPVLMDSKHKDLAVANKLLVEVAGADEAKRYAEDARAAALKVLLDSRDRIYPKFSDTDVNWTRVKEQIADFLEYAAAWVPYEDGPPDDDEKTPYQHARTRVELLLAGRKALRDFRPAKGDTVPKSSLDPSRETVLRHPSNRDEEPAYRSRLHLRGGEQLDGISLLKRHDDPRRFVSTARVAIDPFIRRLSLTADGEIAATPKQRTAAVTGLANLNEIAEAQAIAKNPNVESFKHKLVDGLNHYKRFPYDSQLFYDDGRRDPELQGKIEWQTGAKDFYDEAIRLRKVFDIPELPVYFAVLVADGDKMGEAIGNLQTPDTHRTFSAGLAQFAGAADEIVTKHHGALVYSGGDDVLAFLPLDTALECAEALRHLFPSILQEEAGIEGVTLSVGIAIGHYSEHLQNLLKWARAAEKAAKKVDGKNALAVALHTRTAGATGLTVACPWTAPGKPAAITRWQTWISWHQHEYIPDAAAYALGELARELAGIKDRLPAAEFGELLHVEAVRIIGRRQPRAGPDERVTARRALLESLIGRDLESLRDVATELEIARRIATACDVAGTKVAEPLPVAEEHSHEE